MSLAVLVLAVILNPGTENSVEDQERAYAFSKPSEKYYTDHLKPLRDLFLFKSEMAPCFFGPPQSRIEYAASTNQMLQVHAFSSDLDSNDYTSKFIEDKDYCMLLSKTFWHLEYLLRHFSEEIKGLGVTTDQMWEWLNQAKSNYKKRGIKLRDPYNEKFSDILVDHWSYDAIHNLLRTGILYGYPDGTFRK